MSGFIFADSLHPIEDPDAELQLGSTKNVTFSWDRKRSDHKKYNDSSEGSRKHRHQFAYETQKLWPDVQPTEWLPGAMLPEDHPVHPLNWSGTFLQRVYELAGETRGDVELAHRLLREAVIKRGGPDGGKLGVEDVICAKTLAVHHRTQQGMQQHAGAQISWAHEQHLPNAAANGPVLEMEVEEENATKIDDQKATNMLADDNFAHGQQLPPQHPAQSPRSLARRPPMHVRHVLR